MCQDKNPPPRGRSPRGNLGGLAADTWKGLGVDDMARKSRKRSQGLGGDALGGERFARLPGVLGRLGLHRGMTPFHLDRHPDSCRWKQFVLAVRDARRVLPFSLALGAVGVLLAACGDEAVTVHEGLITGVDIAEQSVELTDNDGNVTLWREAPGDDHTADDWGRFVTLADQAVVEGQPRYWWAEVTDDELGIERNAQGDDEDDAGGD